MNTCIAKACEKPVFNKKRELCRAHNSAYLSTGEMPKREGLCIVPSCDRDGPHREMCFKHYQIWSWTDEGRRLIRGRGQAKTVGYEGAHARVRRARGRASEHVCTDCDDLASEWSLIHDAKSLTVAESGVNAGCLYSPDPYDYSPRCSPCHRKYDALHGLKRQGPYSGQTVRFRSATQERAEEVVRLVKEGATLTEAAGVVGVSVAVATRYFKGVEGQSLREWKKASRAGGSK